MRQLKPILCSMKTTVDNVINFFFGPYYSVKEHLIIRRRLKLMIDSIKHNIISFMKTFKFYVKKLRMSFSF
jgi:hypothetical protein